MSAFVISKEPDGKYIFQFSARKGKIICTSISVNRRSDCIRMIAALQEDPHSFGFRKKRSARGKHFFSLTKEGFVIASSRNFSTERMLMQGIDRLLETISRAEILDFTENDLLFTLSEGTPEGVESDQVNS